MKASTQSKIYYGFVIKSVSRSGIAHYYGPFATKTRAEEYALGIARGIGEVNTIEDLIIPHAMHVYIETQY